MNWSSEWNTPPVWPLQNSREFVKKIDAEFEKAFEPLLQPIIDNLQHKIEKVTGESETITLSIPIEGEWPRTVKAIQVGDLAVHEDIEKPSPWQVTHVPTLTRFNVVPIGDHTQVALIEWCKKVQAENKEDWKELAKLDHSCYKERHGFKDRIMNLCQNTAVGASNGWK